MGKEKNIYQRKGGSTVLIRILLRLRAAFVLVASIGVLAIAGASSWLWWEAGQPRDRWFSERQGQTHAAAVVPTNLPGAQMAQSVQLVSDSGLRVFLRVIRKSVIEEPLPVLVVLGGHRTGSAAVELFGDVGERAVVALDYPYGGPQRVKGAQALGAAIPHIRQAFLDTPPAVSLAVDWLYEQAWVDRAELVMVGVSLGVPFAATAAARDERLSGLLLIHGAADNRLWLEKNLARSIDLNFLQTAAASFLHRLIYGPVFDTREHVSAVSPRPVLIVGAREDERTPDGQAELLYRSAQEPKLLRWTEGGHVDPKRSNIIDELLRIADEERSFYAPNDDA